MKPSLFHWLFIAPFAFTIGCDDGNFPVRPAKGTVTCNGTAVTSGSITFTPIGNQGDVNTGKSATAAVGKDGSFTLSTYGRFDGAIVGKHKVRYTGAEGEESESESKGTSDEDLASASKNKASASGKGATKPQCAQVGEIEIEVNSAGENNFKIELNPAK